MIKINDFGSQHGVSDILQTLNSGSQVNTFFNGSKDSTLLKKNIMKFVNERLSHISESLDNLDFIESMLDGDIPVTTSNRNKFRDLTDSFSVDGSGTIRYLETSVNSTTPVLTTYIGDDQTDITFSNVEGYYHPDGDVSAIHSMVEQSITSGFQSSQIYEYVLAICNCLSGDSAQLANIVTDGMKSSNQTISTIAASLIGLQTDRDYGVIIQRLISIMLDLTNGVSKQVKDSSDGDPGAFDLTNFSNDLSFDFMTSTYTILRNVGNAAMSLIGLFGGVVGMAATSLFGVVTNLIDAAKYPNEITFGKGTDMRAALGSPYSIVSEDATYSFHSDNKEIKLPGIYMEASSQAIKEDARYQSNGIIYPSCNAMSDAYTTTELSSNVSDIEYSYVIREKAISPTAYDIYIPKIPVATSTSDFESDVSNLEHELDASAVISNCLTKHTVSILDQITQDPSAQTYNETVSKWCKNIILSNFFGGLFGLAWEAVASSGIIRKFRQPMSFTRQQFADAWTAFKSSCQTGCVTSSPFTDFTDAQITEWVCGCFSPEIMHDSGWDIVLANFPEWSGISSLLNSGVSIRIKTGNACMNIPGRWCQSSACETSLLGTILSFYCYFISTVIFNNVSTTNYGGACIIRLGGLEFNHKYLYTFDGTDYNRSAIKIPEYDISTNEYPNYPTDPFIIHPKFNASSIRKALLIGVGATVATTVGLIVGKVAIKKVARKIISKREAAAVRDQQAFFNADPSTTSAQEYNRLQTKYIKSQRKFSRVANIFGYSSNNVGSFSTTSDQFMESSIGNGSDVLSGACQKVLSYNDGAILNKVLDIPTTEYSGTLSTISEEIGSIPTTDYSEQLSALMDKVNHIISLIEPSNQLEDIDLKSKSR